MLAVILTREKFSLCFWFACSLLICSFKLSSASLKELHLLGGEDQTTWRVECQLGLRHDPSCPVDGGWSIWSNWGACTGQCDETGKRRRTRICNAPEPKNEGLPCVGADVQEESCYIKDCTAEDFRKLVTGQPLRSAALDIVEAVPAISTKCLSTECGYDTVIASLKNDNAWQLQAEGLWNALQCVKHNVGCPLSGGWGWWGEWSPCTARCGDGERVRTRRCDSPPPTADHLLCTGEPMQKELCKGDTCPPESVDGAWSQWGPWSACSESCGSGVSRRKRSCLDTRSVKKETSNPVVVFCNGHYEEYKICTNEYCSMDGGLSEWSGWGACSQTCGGGRRSRVRSCTRPLPSRDGKTCSGPREEHAPCYVAPCETYTHEVASFNGDGALQYEATHRRGMFVHIYMRFFPLSPTGILLRRSRSDATSGASVTVRLRDWRVFLDIESRYCNPSSLYTRALSPGWHSLLVTVTQRRATLRVDDLEPQLISKHKCEISLPENDQPMWLGEKFNGQIQEAIVNFKSLKLSSLSVQENSRLRRSNGLPPFSESNVAYESADMEEGYLELSDGSYVRIPCMSDTGAWRVDVKIRSANDCGLLFFLYDDSTDTHLTVSLQHMRLKLRLSREDLHWESSSALETTPGQWMDVAVSKHEEQPTIEAVLNGGERVFVSATDPSMRIQSTISTTTKHHTDRSHKKKEKKKLRHKREDQISTSESIEEDVDSEDYTTLVPTNRVIYHTHEQENPDVHNFALCSDEIYLGDVPEYLKSIFGNWSVDSFSGTVGSMAINGELLDLHSYPRERYKNGVLIVSPRTASVSDAYREVAYTNDKVFNLSCVHAFKRIDQADWLELDTAVISTHNASRENDDGQVLRLSIPPTKDLHGFYTCRLHAPRWTHSVVSYGVVGSAREYRTTRATKENSRGSGCPVLAGTCCVAILLVVFTLILLALEALRDIRTGYGYFRDQHLSPEKRAVEIIKFIEKNKHLIKSEEEFEMAKARARKLGGLPEPNEDSNATG